MIYAHQACPKHYASNSISNFIYSNNFIFKNILLELIDIDLQMHLALIGQTSAPRHDLALTLNRNYRRADSSFWFEGFLRFQNLVQHYYDSYKMFIHLILQQLCCTTFDHASNAGASSFPVVESLLMTKCSMTLKHVPPARGNRSVCMSILYSSHIGLEVN